MKKLSLDEEIDSFLEDWDVKNMVAFLHHILPLFELYDVDEEDDWVGQAVGDVHARNIRLIRTVYLMSQIAEFHGEMLRFLNVKYKGLWKRMKKRVDDGQEDTKD